MANKKDYLDSLRGAIRNMHGCNSKWVETVPVHEMFRGKTVWQGAVEVFSLIGHPKAKHAYSWAHYEGENDEKTSFVAVLGIPPVKDAKTAVQASIMADSDGGRK